MGNVLQLNAISLDVLVLQHLDQIVDLANQEADIGHDQENNAKLVLQKVFLLSVMMPLLNSDHHVLFYFGSHIIRGHVDLLVKVLKVLVQQGSVVIVFFNEDVNERCKIPNLLRKLKILCISTIK